MNKPDVERYAAAVFRYCLKRIDSIEDARDLSQEILCEALSSLQKEKIGHFDSWLWTVARNRYCRFISQKKNLPILLCDNQLNALADEQPQSLQEEYQAAFTALHTLAASHRNIMVDHYVNGLTCDEIAKKHNLPPKTVRSRLFYGREKLRKRWKIKMDENRIYQPQQWLMVRNGDVDPAVVDRQIVRGIIAACYEQFQSVEDISLATGLPSMYIEDELPGILHAELLTRKGEKYRANLIVHRPGFALEAEALLLSCSARLSNRVVDILQQITPQIRAIGFHGCDFAQSRLWWSMVPLLVREACTQARQQIPELVPSSRPPRRDGSHGWLCAYASNPAAKDPHYDYLRQKGFRYYWSQELYSTLTLHSMLARLKKLEVKGPEFSLTDEALIADCIRCDLVVRGADGPRWNIPVLTPSQSARLNAILVQAARPLAQELLPVASVLLEKMKVEIPLHLHEQISGVFPTEFLSVIQMVCQILLQKGHLQKPTSELFAGRILMVCGSETIFHN